MKLQENEFELNTPEESNAGFKVMLGALAGAAAGAVLVGLFGTKEGKETRRRVAQGSKDLTTNLKEKLSDFKDRVSDEMDSVKQSVGELVEDGKAGASSVADNLKSEAENLIALKTSTDDTASKATNTTSSGPRYTGTAPNSIENF